LLSALGAAGGLLYALESQHKRNKRANAHKEGDNEAVSGNGRSANAKENGSPQTKPAASMARIENGEASIGHEGEHVIDDQGTRSIRGFTDLEAQVSSVVGITQLDTLELVLRAL